MFGQIYLIGYVASFILSFVNLLFGDEEGPENSVFSSLVVAFFVGFMSWVGVVIIICAWIFWGICSLLEKDKDKNKLLTAKQAYELSEKSAERIRQEEKALMEKKLECLITRIKDNADQNKREIVTDNDLSDEVKERLVKLGYSCQEFMNGGEIKLRIGWSHWSKQ